MPAPALWYRALLILLALRFLPFPLSELPFGSHLAALYTQPWDVLVRWTSIALTGDATNAEFNGSGDRLYDYLQLTWQVGLAVVGAVLWRSEGRSLHRLRAHHLSAYLRYALGASLIGYGVSKLFPWQFPEPSWFELARPIGELSPMALLWVFMGVSRPYTVAAGLAEILGGGLLFFPRTAALGALLVAAIMSNVVLLNLCYDVPVKLYSLTYLFTALLLFTPVAKRVCSTLLQAVALEERGSRRGRLLRAAPALALLLVTASSLSPLWTEQDRASHQTLIGFYSVVSFSATDTEPAWVQAELTPYAMFVRRSDGSQQAYGIDGSRLASSGTLTLTPFAGGTTPIAEDWRVSLETDSTLELQRSGPPSVTLRLRRSTSPGSPLTARGFHWINERPYIR